MKTMPKTKFNIYVNRIKFGPLCTCSRSNLNNKKSLICWCSFHFLSGLIHTMSPKKSKILSHVQVTLLLIHIFSATLISSKSTTVNLLIEKLTLFSLYLRIRRSLKHWLQYDDLYRLIHVTVHRCALFPTCFVLIEKLIYHFNDRIYENQTFSLSLRTLRASYINAKLVSKILL